jgi:GNAT superfamily N-acetyltransferase
MVFRRVALVPSDTGQAHTGHPRFTKKGWQCPGTNRSSRTLWARRNGCRFMTLGVFPGNERARALYERHGYGVELLRMAKPLN